MDVDAVAIGEGSDTPNWRGRRGDLRETERKKRQQEGRRFLCETTGPYAARMPEARGRKKSKGRDNRGRRGESVRATKVEGNGEGSL